MQQNTTPWYLFDSIIRECGSINVALGHSPSKLTSKKPGKKEVYSIIEINLRSEALALLGIKVIAKLGDVNH